MSGLKRRTSRMRWHRSLAVLAIFLLAGCGEEAPRLKFGAKNFGESEVLAHMMAALAEEQGLPVEGVVDYPSTQAILEALKRGDIDAYPEYNGTGLVMLGQNPMSDGDAATARVKDLFEPLGLSWRARFGFANNYGLAMRTERAADLGVATMSELVSRAGELTLGVEDDFVTRPLDGLEPMTRRYGFSFAEVAQVPLDDRAELYDLLLDGQADVIEIYTTDGQIADYGLTVLEDDLDFFPVYQAAPLVRASSLAAHPQLAAVLDALDGRIDAEAMRDLNRKVDIEGRAPDAVALDALARMGLIESGAVTSEEPLLVAASPFVSDGDAANRALRATRLAFRGREVVVAPDHAALEQVASGEARLALASADAFYDYSGPAPVRDERFEAVVAVGQNVIHIVTAIAGPIRLTDVTTIATGPEGSPSHRLAGLLISGLGLSATRAPVQAEGVDAVLAALEDGTADTAFVMAPEGDGPLDAAFATKDLRLLPITGWSEGANLVRYPFLRETRISERAYRGQFGAVDTLGAQLVLAGPTPQRGDLVGDAGPSAVATGLTPISNEAVEALNAAIVGSVRIDPTLRQAAALAPELPEPPAALNPAPDVSVLSIAIIAMLIWMVWLYIRPEYR